MSLIPGLNKLRFGSLIRFHENDWYVKIPSSKTESLLPKWYVKHYLKFPKVGDKILCYVANAVNSLGYTHINQERLLYLLNLVKLQMLLKKNQSIEVEICKFRYGGYIVKLLPHFTYKLNYFYAFLPLSFTSYYGNQIEGRLVNVKIKSFNYQERSIVVQSVSDNSIFGGLEVGSLVNGIVLHVNPGAVNFLVDNYQATLPYGMMFFDSKLPSDFDVRETFKERSVINNLQIIKKDFVTNKLILSSAHLFDNIENYFSKNQPVKAKIVQVHPNFYVVKTESGIIGKLPMNEFSWKHKFFNKVKKHAQLKVKLLKYQYSKIMFTCKTDEDNFWPQVQAKVPLFQGIRSSYLFGKVNNLKFTGDSENYLLRLSFRDRIHHLLVLWWFKNHSLERNKQYNLVPLSYNVEKGYIGCTFQDIYLAYSLLNLSRNDQHQARIVKLGDRHVHLETVDIPYPFTFVTQLQSIDDKFSYQVGSLVKFKISEFNLTSSRIAKFDLT